MGPAPSISELYTIFWSILFLELHIYMIWSSLNICCVPGISTVCVFIPFIILIPSQYCFVPFWHDFYRFSCPGSRNPVFCPVIRFFEKYLFGIYMLWGVSGCKNFTGQILSGIRFYPKSIIIRHFSYFVTILDCYGVL